MASAVVPLFRRHEEEAPRLSLDELYGRLVEISGKKGGAQLTAAFGLVALAQERSEPVAIVQAKAETFFPPDVHDGGIDLDALVVVRIDKHDDEARAAEQLIRSGAFGLVVLDLTTANQERAERARDNGARRSASGREGPRARVPMPLLSRLAGLAKKHECVVVFLTVKSGAEESIGSLVSLRAEAKRGRDEEGFVVELVVIKDKRRAPGREAQEACRGPAGLR